MKKKFVAMIMAAFMAVTMLAGCGDNTEVVDPAPSSETPAQNDVQPAAADPAESNMVSDETFAIIQENYAVMVQYHDIVAATYNSDEIAANSEIETVMAKAADLIVKMGEIKQDMLTEEDAVTLNDLIIGIVDSLTVIVQNMEVTGGDASGAEGTPVTDETFAILQQNWTTLTEFYNQVATAYNNGEIEKSEDFEAMMNQAADILEQIQNISRDDLTEEKAVEINDTMINIQDTFGEALGLVG